LVSSVLLVEFMTLNANSSADFNLDFYTEVQDLSYLENALSTTSPRFTALNMAMISLIEDYSLVGFETLAVEVRFMIHISLNLDSYTKIQDKYSMLHLTRAIDRATGYVFVPPPASAPPGTVPPPADISSSAKPNTYALFSTAAGPLHGPRSNIQDVQERWVDARDEWDAYEKVQWGKEAEMVRDGSKGQDTRAT
jgi:hypothetical protein